MSNRDSCTHHFEHVKQTRPFTEREYMQCAKCGLRNPLGLFQHWDTERDGPAPMPGFKRNSYVYRTSIPQHIWPKIPNIIGRTGHGMTTDEYLEAEKQRQEGMKIAAKYIRKRYGPKRKHAITVRKLSGWYGNFWKFSCTPCGLSINYPTWETAYESATRHAHNHH